MPEYESDLVQIGASEATRRTLETLKEEGHISDMLDGYRLGVAVAMAFGCEPSLERGSSRKTMFAATAVDDSSQTLRQMIHSFYPEAANVPYRAIEDLAEQGLQIVEEHRAGEDISFADLMTRVRLANDQLGDG